jgi:MYXO-CTERM domain-containing protein
MSRAEVPRFEGGNCMARATWFVGAALLCVAQTRGAAAEFCGEAAQDSGFQVSRVWPVDCAQSTPLEALVYVAGAGGELRALSAPSELGVRVFASRDGEPRGDALAGELEFVQGGSVALWRGAAPFAPRTEYTLTAGRPGGKQVRSTFVTGDAAMAPIALRGELDVTFRTVETAQQACSFDACGERSCQDGDGVVERTRVSIYVPPLDGGLPAAQGETFAPRYDVVAVFAEGPGADGHIFASKKVSVEPRSHNMVELDIPVLPEAFEGCALVTIADLTGATLELPPQCVTVAPDGGEYEQVLESVRSAPESDASMASAGGCNVGNGGTARAWLPVLMAALLLLIARRKTLP